MTNLSTRGRRASANTCSIWGLPTACGAPKRLYNRLISVADKHCVCATEKEKPQVTEILTTHSYTWGWRSETDYDLFLGLGQEGVVRPHRQRIFGEWRWLVTIPHITGNNPIAGNSGLSPAAGRSLTSIRGCLPGRLYAWLFTGQAARCNKRRRPGRWNSLVFVFVAITTASYSAHKCWTHFWRKTPDLGRGIVSREQFALVKEYHRAKDLSTNTCKEDLVKGEI